jgi:hypothetical protein
MHAKKRCKSPQRGKHCRCVRAGAAVTVCCCNLGEWHKSAAGMEKPNLGLRAGAAVNVGDCSLERCHKIAARMLMRYLVPRAGAAEAAHNRILESDANLWQGC